MIFTLVFLWKSRRLRSVIGSPFHLIFQNILVSVEAHCIKYAIKNHSGLNLTCGMQNSKSYRRQRSHAKVYCPEKRSAYHIKNTLCWHWLFFAHHSHTKLNFERQNLPQHDNATTVSLGEEVKCRFYEESKNKFITLRSCTFHTKPIATITTVRRTLFCSIAKTRSRT